MCITAALIGPTALQRLMLVRRYLYWQSGSLRVFGACHPAADWWCHCVQMGSFFVMQGANMDRNMFGGRFVIPSASLSLFNTISIITLIPIYDRGVVPLLQRFGMKITHLQRIGKGSGIAHAHSNCWGVQRQADGGWTSCILGHVDEQCLSDALGMAATTC